MSVRDIVDECNQHRRCAACFATNGGSPWTEGVNSVALCHRCFVEENQIEQVLYTSVGYEPDEENLNRAIEHCLEWLERDTDERLKRLQTNVEAYIEKEKNRLQRDKKEFEQTIRDHFLLRDLERRKQEIRRRSQQ